MNDNDYIVMIDENGQPYLAHAFGDRIKNLATTMNRKIRNNVGAGSRARKDHKYIMRVDNYFSPGKHLYLYTQDEVDAYMGRNGNKKGSRTLSNRIRDKLGWDERSARDDARANSGSNESNRMRYKAAQDEYNKTALGKLENLGNRLKSTTLGAIRGAKKAAKWVDDHDAGLTETVRYAAKRNKVDEDERKQLHREMVEGGKIGRLANRVGESNTAHRITEAAYNPGQAARNVGASVSNAARNAGASVGNAARNAGNAVKNAPQNVASTARNAAGNISSIIDERITGNSAQQAMSSSGQNALMGLDGAAAEYVDAVNKYNNSLEGATKNGLNSAVTKAKDGLDKARSSLQSAWKSASNYLTKDQRAAAQAEIDTMMGLDGSIGEWYDTHKVK